MDMKKMKGLFVVLLIGLLALASVGCTEKFDQAEVDAQLEALNLEHQAEVNALSEELASLTDEKLSLESDVADIEGTVAELSAQIEELLAVPEEPVVEEPAPSYLFRDVELDGNFAETIDSDALESLFLGEVDYDGEDYDAEEVLVFNADFLPVLNVEDFGADIAIEVGAESFAYKLVFDTPVEMVDGEDFVVNFLGRELTIVSSDDDEITYRTSQKVTLSLGGEYTYHDSIIKVVGFNDGDTDAVLLTIDGEVFSLEEDDTERNNGVKVSVKDIIISSIGDYNSVVLYVGEDIVETVSDKMVFDDDDRYDWIVKSDADGISEIGVLLIEELTEEDEVMALGDSLSLPYDYKTVTFESLNELDVTDLTASVRTDEIKIKFDGKIEIDGKKIDDGVFTFDGTTVEYEYKGDDKTSTDLTEIVIFVGDRELSFASDADSFTIGTYDFGYVFGVKEITSAPEGDEDADYRFVYGDILYKSDANNADDEETSIKLGLVNDEDKEVVLKVE